MAHIVEFVFVTVDGGERPDGHGRNSTPIAYFNLKKNHRASASEEMALISLKFVSRKIKMELEFLLSQTLLVDIS